MMTTRSKIAKQLFAAQGGQVNRNENNLSHRSVIEAAPLAGVYVVATDSVRSFPRHWHGSFGLGLVDRGAQRSASGRGAVDAFAGQCIAHNPGEVHDGKPIGATARRWRMFHVEPDAMARLLGVVVPSALEWQSPVLKDEAVRTALCSAFDVSYAASAHQAEDATTEAPRMKFEEALLMAVGRAFEVARPSPPRRPRAADLTIVMQRLTDDVANAPTLDELAALAGTSRFALVRQFGRRYGLPPLTWLLQLRLQRARERIGAGWSLADTAAACGFSDQSHLTRVFSRQFGHTPGAWRKAAAAPRPRRAIAQ
jgi:AraC-like DNA-binding protein